MRIPRPGGGAPRHRSLKMAVPSPSSRQFERSLSYSEDMHRKKFARSHSIVGSLWNMLYARGQSSIEMGEQLRAKELEDTDHPAECANKQEDAWMQAYYNSVALVVLAIAGCICWAVYCVLEPFLHPLLWAVLVGTLLHPFKKMWTERISQWLDGLEDNSIPLSAGLFFSPIFFFNYLSKSLESAVAMHWGTMLGSAVGVALLWLLYKLSVPFHLYRSLASVHSFLLTTESALTSYTGPVQLATLTIGFVLLLVITKSQVHLRYTTAVAILSTGVWFLALFNVATYVVGSAIALPLVVGLFLTGAGVSCAVTVKGMFDHSNSRKSTTTVVPKVTCEEGGEGGVREAEGGKDSGEESYLEEVKCSGALESEGQSDREEGGVTSTDSGREPSTKSESRRLSFEGPGDKMSRSRVSFCPVTQVSSERPSHEYAGESETAEMAVLRKEPTDDNRYSNSDYIFLGLYISFFMMVFWTYPFLLILLLPFAVWGALKRVISVGRRNTSLSKLFPVLTALQGWLAARKSLLVPAPIPTLLRLYLLIDRKILKIAKGSVDSLISLFIICGLLVSVLGLTVFLVLQIQVELSHYVTMMAAVWERALASSPQLAEWIGGGNGTQSIQETFGSFANQGYVYGREWLAGQVQSLLSDTSDKNSAIEKQVLNLYDQLYQSYVLANTSTLEVDHTPEMKDGDLLNELQIVIMENLETVISVLKSMWAVLSNNFSLAVSLLYTVLELLLSGGTALLNAVVFLTTLFYLLCYSADVYLPVKMVLDVLPSVTQTDTAGEYTASFSRAIRSVFHASLSRFVFYGLYTWLVHTAFGLPVSILPAVLAAIAGALPFIGPYWIALPAILELWLVEGQTVSAITILILSLLPMFFIDSIIYGEVEGGHPYLTGLAVAGGIYFSGLEGALIGPILLCCLVFIHELFGELFNHSHETAT